MNNDVSIVKVFEKVELREGTFVDEKTGQVIKYYTLYIPDVKKKVKVQFTELEKDYLDISE